MFKAIQKILCGAAIFCGIFVFSCSSPNSTPAPSPAIGNWNGTVSLTDSESVSAVPTRLNETIDLLLYITSSTYTRTQTDTATTVSYVTTDSTYSHDSTYSIGLLGLGGDTTVVIIDSTSPVTHVSPVTTTSVYTDTGTWTTSGNSIVLTTPRYWVSVNGATPTIQTAPYTTSSPITGISGNTWSFPFPWTKLNGSSATASIALTD
jgi:hypothetical protein